MAHLQLSLPYDCITPDYIPFLHNEPLEAYSLRFGKLLLAENKIDPNRPLFISGYSLGSAIGQELARFIPSRGVILIGGLLTSDEIRAIPRFFGRYICWWLPLWIYQTAKPFIIPVMLMISGILKKEVQLAATMYRDIPQGLFRDGSHAIAQWAGCRVNVSVSRIHGEKDHIISCPKPGKNIVIIPSAKHLVGLAKPEAVNIGIEQFIDSQMHDRT